MSYWDCIKQIIVTFPPKKHKNGWYELDCGCCNGLEWGGYSPRECRNCGGSGSIWWHRPSGVYALYPGGELRGRNKILPKELIEE